MLSAAQAVLRIYGPVQLQGKHTEGHTSRNSMTFTTLTFLVFLSAVFLLYWSLKNHFKQNVLLLFASYFFYGWWDYRFCLLMFVTSLLDYSVGLLIYRTAALRGRRLLLIFNVIC